MLADLTHWKCSTCRSAKNPPYKSLVLRHLHNGISDLLLCDRVAKGRQVALREVYALPIEIMCPSLALVQHGSEVLLGQLLFLIMMHHCGAGGRSSSFTGIHTKVKQNHVLASPSLMLSTRAHCFLRALSNTARPVTLLLSLALRSCSSGERGHDSWVMSS